MMATFIQKLVLFLLIQLAIGLLLIVNAMHQPQYGFMAAFEDKIRLLRDHDEPSLIVLGGSNVAFGIDSPSLQERFDLPVINGGLHAELGLQFYLDVASDSAKPGDVIILLPEWKLLIGATNPKSELRLSMIQESPASWRYLWRMDGSELKSFVDKQALGLLAGLIQSGSRLSRESENQRNFVWAQNPGVYSRLKFSSQGDFVGHHGLGTIEEIEKLGINFSFEPEEVRKSVGRINACARSLNERGVHIYLAYCPIPTPHFEKWEDEIESIHQLLVENLEIPVLHEPAQVNYPTSYFYDTVCHLNLTGKMDRTEVVAQSLQRQFRIASKPNAELLH